MVKILKINQYSHKDGKQLLLAELFADSKNDDFTKIVGVGGNEALAMGSSVLTAEGDFALLDSTGTWKWQ
jgi:ethanolamine utilization microcompartment shell protein EutS